MKDVIKEAAKLTFDNSAARDFVDPRAAGRARVKAELENAAERLALFDELVNVVGRCIFHLPYRSDIYLDVKDILERARALQGGGK